MVVVDVVLVVATVDVVDGRVGLVGGAAVVLVV